MVLIDRRTAAARRNTGNTLLPGGAVRRTTATSSSSGSSLLGGRSPPRSLSGSSGANGGSGSSHHPHRRPYDKEKLAVVAIAAFGCCLFLYALFTLAVSGVSTEDGTAGSGGKLGSKTAAAIKAAFQKHQIHPQLHVQGGNVRNAETYNAIALDILKTLDCYNLLNKTMVSKSERADFLNQLDDDLNQRKTIRQRRLHQLDSHPLEQFHRHRRLLSEEVGGAGGDQLDDDATAPEPKETDDARGLGGGAGALDDDEKANEGGQGQYDDDAAGGAQDDDDTTMGRDDEKTAPSGLHLFCMAAMQRELHTDLLQPWMEQVQCDAVGSQQQYLLELWSMARADMPLEKIHATLSVAREQTHELVGHKLHLWAPQRDDGIHYMLQTLNDENQDVDHGGIYGLFGSLKQQSVSNTQKKPFVFVDVGSCLGLTSMAVALLYPGTRIISIEPAAPNWLLQEMNWRCHPEFNPTPTVGDINGNNDDGEPNKLREVLRTGVGPSHQTLMAKFLWRPTSTTSTRAWTPKIERVENDQELTVKLQPWRQILSLAGLLHDHKQDRIDVLNVDCEGCEYNLIYDMSEKEFAAISTVMGGMHWGYIPKDKKPSSKRAKETHQRLCTHENFARNSIECCAFPDQAVTSSVPGEVLYREDGRDLAGGRSSSGGGGLPKQVTVSDVAGDLCKTFPTWAKENFLYDIEGDWGWFQMNSVAE